VTLIAEPFVTDVESNFERCVVPRASIEQALRNVMGDTAWNSAPACVPQGFEGMNSGDRILCLVLKIQREAYWAGRLSGFDEPAQLRDAFRQHL